MLLYERSVLAVSSAGWSKMSNEGVHEEQWIAVIDWRVGSATGCSKARPRKRKQIPTWLRSSSGSGTASFHLSSPSLSMLIVPQSLSPVHHIMATASAQAGPSRTQIRSNVPPAPSTSGDSESTQQKDADSNKGGLDVSILREVARTALVESLNEVSPSLSLGHGKLIHRYKVPRR